METTFSRPEFNPWRYAENEEEKTQQAATTLREDDSDQSKPKHIVYGRTKQRKFVASYNGGPLTSDMSASTSVAQQSQAIRRWINT